VDYLRPTPLGVPLEVRGHVREVKGRKVVIGVIMTAQGTVCAKGEVVTVRVPDDWLTEYRPA
jgi:acyl-CoA thioesterase FadM